MRDHVCLPPFANCLVVTGGQWFKTSQGGGDPEADCVGELERLSSPSGK